MTAERFLERITEDKGDDMENIYHAMIEFAKYHVEKALEEASQKGESYVIGGLVSEIDKDSIINAYPLENIK